MGSDLVREARRRAGLTQRELAERAGTTQSAIARLESGKTSPSFDTVRRLLRLCGFNLLVALDPYDDSDLAQAKARLSRSPDERLRENDAGLAFARELQGAFARSRA
ncbi:MAG: helix-turn-helix domain-containing protein [Actinobacteria bacterium]|nr:helix-turn-helix domain-containing protein [Actinomycetota bacterium]MCA1721530.1 helix-turn-helix domain-containing protein [Actinomycetota bacterium]